MDPLVFSLLAIALYLIAASWLAVTVPRAAGVAARLPPLGLVVAALGFHAVALYRAMVTQQGLNLGILDAGSLIAWVILLLLLLLGMRKPIANLLLVLLPLAALLLGLEMLLPSQRLIPLAAPRGLQIHVVLSIIANSLLAIAALQAVILALGERQLHSRRPLGAMRWLPPLAVMETILFQFIGSGFIALSLSLVTGFFFLDDIFAQHLVHKTTLGIAAWLVFAVLLWGRWRFGWRGRLATRFTLAGFAILLLAYFGTKLVLEVILERV